jgi:hypothetical protein
MASECQVVSFVSQLLAQGTQLSNDLLVQPWALLQQIEKLQKKRRLKPKG